ncbi:MAG: exosortase-associated EpsI family protein [Armatimonadetes bacterium]|nr:exosortase-associated EpsI family protein [Armatimonadota bacterium]
MQSRVKFVIVFFALAGLASLFLHAKQYPQKSEAWMEAAVPEEIDGYTFTTSSKRDATVRMDEMTYEILKPFGIVVRNFTGQDGKNFDFVVIAGNSRKSFHDPQVCFSAQNWQLIDPKLQEINLPSVGGKVPATVMGLKRPGANGVAMYFYRGPMGWRHSPLYIPFDLTFAKLLMKDDADAQFFRFIMSPATTPADATRESAAKTRKQDVDALSKFADSVFRKLKATDDGAYFVSR